MAKMMAYPFAHLPLALKSGSNWLWPIARTWGLLCLMMESFGEEGFSVLRELGLHMELQGEVLSTIFISFPPSFHSGWAWRTFAATFMSWMSAAMWTTLFLAARRWNRWWDAGLWMMIPWWTGQEAAITTVIPSCRIPRCESIFFFLCLQLSKAIGTQVSPRSISLTWILQFAATLFNLSSLLWLPLSWPYCLVWIFVIVPHGTQRICSRTLSQFFFISLLRNCSLGGGFTIRVFFLRQWFFWMPSLYFPFLSQNLVTLPRIWITTLSVRPSHQSSVTMLFQRIR